MAEDYIQKKRTVLTKDLETEIEQLEAKGYTIVSKEDAGTDFNGNPQTRITYGVPVVEGEIEVAESKGVTWENDDEYQAQLEEAGIETIKKRNVIVSDKSVMKSILDDEMETKVFPPKPGATSVKPPPVDQGFMAWYADLFRSHSVGGKQLEKVVSDSRKARSSRSYR